jgi:hypothetical protein
VTESWKTGYRKALTRYLVANAGIAHPRDTYYGWQNYEATRDFREHGKTCKTWTIVGDVTEDMMWQFAGTFADDERQYQVVAKVTCKCGKYTEQEIRLGGTSMSEVIRGVLDA